MKFSIYNLLTLLSVGSAISSNLEGTLLPKNVINLISNELITDRHLFARDDPVVDTTAQLQCSDSINNSNCIYKTLDPMNMNYDEYCKILKDEKCVSFYNKGVSELDGCKGLPNEFVELNDKQLKFQFALMKAVCELDEEGKECPFASTLKSLIYNLTRIEKISSGDEMKKLAKDTCKSQKCTENTKNYFSEYYDYMSVISKSQIGGGEIADTNKENDEFLKFLDSKECVEAQVLKSDASSTVKKLGTTMLISISLLLYLL